MLEDKGKNAWVRLIFSALIFTVFIVLIEQYYGWSYLLAPWQGFSWGLLFVAVLLVFLSYLLRALRYYDYFGDVMQGLFASCFKLTLQHNLLVNLLPMRTGEISFPLLMSRYFNVPVSRSVPVLFWFRLLDLHVLLLIAIVALGTAILSLPLTIAAFLIWFMVPWLLFRASGRLLTRYDDSQEGAGWLHNIVHKILISLPQTNTAYWRSWGWTALNWVVKMGVFSWVMLQFIDVSWNVALTGIIAGDLSSALPINGIAGMGFYEAGVVAGMALYSVDVEQALLAAVNIHIFVLGTALLGGLVGFLIRRKASI